MDKYLHHTFCDGFNYSSMLRLKLLHIKKWDPDLYNVTDNGDSLLMLLHLIYVSFIKVIPKSAIVVVSIFLRVKSVGLWPLILTWFNYNLSMDVAPLKFGNGKVISSHTLLHTSLIIHVPINVTRL